MAIWLYSGTPGGGKTYSLVAAARAAFKRGTAIYANFPFLLPNGSTPYVLDRETLREGVPPGSLAVLTEIGQWYNSRDWRNFTPEDYKVFTLHRHLGINMIMDVQHPSRVDVSVRQIVEGVWWTRRPHAGPIDRPWWEAPWLVQHAYQNVEDIGTEKHIISRRLVWLKKAVFRAYDTTWEKSKLPMFDKDWPRWEWGGTPALPLWRRVWAKIKR